MLEYRVKHNIIQFLIVLTSSRCKDNLNQNSGTWLIFLTTKTFTSRSSATEAV